MAKYHIHVVMDTVVDMIIQQHVVDAMVKVKQQSQQDLVHTDILLHTTIVHIFQMVHHQRTNIVAMVM